jgi:hypothetical protein
MTIGAKFRSASGTNLSVVLELPVWGESARKGPPLVGLFGSTDQENRNSVFSTQEPTVYTSYSFVSTNEP